MQKVIITGAAGALGTACVKQFLNHGFHVIALLSHKGKSAYDNVKGVSSYAVNLADENETNKAIDQIIEDHGPIGTGLFLVGGFSMGSLETTDGDAIRKMITLNFETAYNPIRRLFSHMEKQKKGRMILVGSRPALDPKAAKSMVAYSLSKSLVFRLGEILNEEGKDKGIVATVVVPSVINTEDNRKAMPKADPSRWVTPEQIASIIAFATSPEGEALREPVLKIYGDS